MKASELCGAHLGKGLQFFVPEDYLTKTTYDHYAFFLAMISIEHQTDRDVKIIFGKETLSWSEDGRLQQDWTPAGEVQIPGFFEIKLIDI